jgi:hypothetical protein
MRHYASQAHFAPHSHQTEAQRHARDRCFELGKIISLRITLLMLRQVQVGEVSTQASQTCVPIKQLASQLWKKAESVDKVIASLENPSPYPFPASPISLRSKQTRKGVKKYT